MFTIASVSCGFAPDARWLILARAAQGVGGALLAPGSLAIISASFPDDRRGVAIGTWSAFTAIATALGPVLGGVFVEYLSWRWVFFINLPLAMMTVGLTLWKVPESRDDLAPRSLDWAGAGLATTGLGLVVYGLTAATNFGLRDPQVLGTILGGLLSLGFFVAAEARSRSPMLPLSLFQSRNFSAANFLTLLLYGSLSGSLFFVPFNLIQVQGYSTTAAGAAMLPFVAMIFILSRWSGGLVTRIGPKALLVAGPLVFGAATMGYLLPGIGGSYWTTFLPIVLLQGLGMAIAVAPLTTVVLGSISPAHAGIASGVNNAVSRTGGLLAVALIGIVAVAVFGAQFRQSIARLSSAEQVSEALIAEQNHLASIDIPTGLPAQTRAAVQDAIDQAFVRSFRAVEVICALLAFAAGLGGLALTDTPPMGQA